MNEDLLPLLGTACKHRIVELLQRDSPTKSGVQVFWNGETFSLIFQSKEDYKWAKKHQEHLLEQIKQFFVAADINQQCENYPIRLEFGYGEKMNLFHQMREDIQPTDLTIAQNVPELGRVRWRIAPWIAFTIGLLWVLIVWADKKSKVSWSDLYPGISLIAAGFVYNWVNEWLDRDPNRTAIDQAERDSFE
jgi:hypothetical protein